jgi:hypothetical protein
MLNIMKIGGREGATTFIYTSLGTYLKNFSMETLNLFEQPFNSTHYPWKLDSVQINQFENYFVALLHVIIITCTFSCKSNYINVCVKL